MARRSDHNRDELTELIINATQNIVEKEGFSNLSARKISNKIGYTVGTLYNVFEDLNEIILNVNARTLDKLYLNLSSEVALCKKKEQVLYKLASGYISFSHKNFKLWNMLFEHHFPRPKGTKLPSWYESKMNKPFLLAEEALLPHLKKSKHKCRELAKVFWACLHGICILSMGGKLGTVGAPQAKDLVESFVKIFVSGVNIKN